MNVSVCVLTRKTNPAAKLLAHSLAESMSLALTAPDYVVSERDGAWAMMLHGVNAKDGTSDLKILNFDELKHIWGFVNEVESWPTLEALRKQVEAAAAPSDQLLGKNLSTNPLTNRSWFRRLLSNMSTEVPAIKLRELLERAEKKGWLDDLADQIAACQLIKYREWRAAFLPLMARGDFGNVSPKTDKVLQMFTANLKLGQGLKYPRAVPAILLLREAVNKGWKEMLAKDVAAAEQARRDAPDDSDDDDLPDMT